MFNINECGLSYSLITYSNPNACLDYRENPCKPDVVATPVVPATQESEAGEWFKSKNSGLASAAWQDDLSDKW